MYDYTKNIYKAVKSTLKTQIKVFLQAKYKQQNGSVQRSGMVHYSVGAVVYGCTTPLIHGVKGDGCLSEKFF